MKKFELKKRIQQGIIGISAVTLLAGSGAQVFAHSAHRGGDGRNGHRDNSQSRRAENNNRGAWWRDRNNNDPTCNERQESVNNQVDAFKTKAAEQHMKLTSFYETQKTYVDNNQLEVRSYEQLTAKADKAGAKASELIEGVEPPELNCNRSQRNDRKAVDQVKRPVQKAQKAYRDRVAKTIRAIWNEVR